MIYTILFRPSVKKDLRRIPSAFRNRIEEILLQLQIDPLPQGIRALEGYNHHYRLRVGDYRIIYEIKHEIRIVSIIRIRHRKDAYKQM